MTNRHPENRQPTVTPLSVSVAMSTYNGSAFLQEQLDSIAQQSHPPDELVVCDDASTDDTVQVMERFALKASFPVRLHVNTTNLAFRKNLEKAVTLTSGDLILPADHDDVWHEEKIARTVAIFEQRPEVGIVLCDADVVDDQLKPKGHRIWQTVGFSEAYQNQAAAGCGFEVLLRHSFVGAPTMAFRAKFKELLVPIPPGWYPDAWMALLICAVSESSLIPEPMFVYRQSRAQMAGMKRKGLRQKYAEARQRVGYQYFDRMTRHHEAARDRLCEFERVFAADQAIELLNAKIALSRSRAAMRQHLFVLRPFLVFKELLLRRYHQFAHGWKTALLDLII